MIILIRSMHIRFFGGGGGGGGGISTAKMSVTIHIKSSHKTLEGISTAKIS